MGTLSRSIGYRNKDIKKAIEKAKRGPHPRNTQPSINKKAYLPYVQGVDDKIAKVLKRREITTSFKPMVTIRQKMRSVKDTIDHQQYKGVYKVACSYEICYIVASGHSFHIGLNEQRVVLTL